MDLLPATLLQQKIDYYLHHLYLRVPNEVRKEFKAMKQKTSLREKNLKAWRQTLKDLDDKVDDIMISILSQSQRSPMLRGLGHIQHPFTTFRREDISLKKQLIKSVRQLGKENKKIQTDNGSTRIDNNASQTTDHAEEQSLQTSLIRLGSRNYGVRPSAYDVMKGTNTPSIHANVMSRIEDLLLNYQDKRFKVIGVIGKRGIGKTRVVTHVYQNDEVRKFFDYYAMISNPLSSEPKKILREMLHQFYFGSPPYTLETMDQLNLQLAINKCLKKKKFLLVLDGVSDFELWEKVIFPAFPFGRQLDPLGPIVSSSSFIHGRIVFTSNFPHRRIFDPLVNQVYFQIRLKALSLSQEEPLALLRQLVFQDTEPPETWSLEPEGIAREIIKKSGGLPFVIRLLAEVLRGNRSTQLWQKRLNQLKELEEDSKDDTVRAILLSYDVLETLALKSCFLYFCFFPKDDEIPLERVIRLWVAEGLVEETPEKTATEVSMAYLQELMNRGLIQPAGHVDARGVLKYCKVDEKIRRVALDIIGSNKRYSVQSTDNVGSSSSSGTAAMPSMHFLSIQGKDIVDIKPKKIDAKRVQSCIISGSVGELQSSIMDRCLAGFQLLRVLDLNLDDSQVETFPKGLGTLVLLVYLRLKGSKLLEVPTSVLEKLIHLRYLGLRKTGIKELPDATSLLKLKDLHTLDVRETKLRKLPIWVSLLPRLQHIYLSSSFRREFVEMPLAKNPQQQPLKLQTLAGVRATRNLIVKQLERWTQLRKLSIGRVVKADSEKLCASINKMNFLRSLSKRSEINESLDMKSLEFSTNNLDTLRIGGSVEDLNSAIKCFPSSLCRLFLWDNLLPYDPLPVLQDLPNLMVLSLTNTFTRENISCNDGFPELKRLSIFQMRNLKNWEIKGGMNKLEFLYIGHCPNMKEPPQELKNLPSLQLLMVADMEQMVEKIEKEDRFKVRSIPLLKRSFEL